VDDVSFTIGEREIVALAGESGSGKSTIARLLARIYKPTSGEAFFEGKPLSSMTSRQERLRYSGQVPMVFQDPFSSLNPVFRVSHGVLRALKLHRPELSADERRAEAARVFDVVGLGAGMLDRYAYDVQYHEYGHYVMDSFNFENNPGGPHNIGDCIANVHSSKDQGVRLAWGEGWPTYWGTTVQRVGGVGRISSDGRGNVVIVPFTSSTASADVSRITRYQAPRRR